MYENFSSRARMVLLLAHEEVLRLGHDYIDTEHLLLGLIYEGGAAAKVMSSMNMSMYSIREEVNKRKSTAEFPFRCIEWVFAPQARRILQAAREEALHMSHEYVSAEHILLAMMQEKECTAACILEELGFNLSAMRRRTIEMMAYEAERDVASTPFFSLGNVGGNKSGIKRGRTVLLNEFGRNLNRMAEEGKIDPVIGRDKEVERLIQILCRRTKNNPVLIGEPGVGKTAIVEGLAQRITEKKVPPLLLNKRVISLSMAAMVAGSKYRGDFEERLRRIMQEITEDKSVIAFIDEIHTLIGAGDAVGAIDAANILKPALARGELQVIGATTIMEYRKYMEKDGALERRFQPIWVNESSQEETLHILHGLRERYESHHAVSITDEALQAAVHFAHRYITGRYLPDKAIDLMDEAAAHVSVKTFVLPLQQEENPICSAVTKEHVAQVVSLWTGIPLQEIAEEEAERLLRLEAILHRRLVGQEEAVHAVAQVIRRARAGIRDPRRPIGSFLFLGPTGVGKTELAKSLAQALFGSEDAMIRLNMSEYMDKNAVSRLLGAPPGYIGYEDGGQLTEAIRRKPYSVLLLDELEKAHCAIFHVLLQVLEDGCLTDSQGHDVDFKNTIIIMTSNAGALCMKKRGGALGFSTFAAVQDEALAKMQLIAEVKKLFQPEFLNRIDEIIVFSYLTLEERMTIVDMMLAEMTNRLQEKHIRLEIAEQVKAELLKCGDDFEYGARPLRRAIQKMVEDEVAEIVLRRQTYPGGTIQVAVDAKGNLIFQTQ